MIPPASRFVLAAALLTFSLGISPSAGGEAFFSTLEKKPHLRVGLSARKISVDFSITPNTTLPFSAMPNLSMGMGDVGLFTDTSGNIIYENGSVGPSSMPGSADAIINDVSQITPTGRYFMGEVPVDQVTFNTMSMFTINEAVTGSGLTISDDQAVVGPYIDLVIPLTENADRFTNFVVGYRFYDTDHGFGPQLIGYQKAAAYATTNTYQYDFLDYSAPTDPASYPYSSSDSTIYDAAAFSRSNDLLDPRTSSTTGNTFTNIMVFSQTSLNLNLHEIPFGFECGRQIGKSTFSLTAGGTLNIVDLRMSSWTTMYQYGGRNLIHTRTSHHTDTPVKLGAYAGVNFTHPLNDDGSCYLNIHGSYRWVDSFTASTADVSANIDLSSWEGGVGIGIIFD